MSKSKYRTNYIKGLVRDIRENGYCYLKSESTAKEVRSLDSNVEIIYNKDDRSYIATYKTKRTD